MSQLLLLLPGEQELLLALLHLLQEVAANITAARHLALGVLFGALARMRGQQSDNALAQHARASQPLFADRAVLEHRLHARAVEERAVGHGTAARVL